MSNESADEFYKEQNRELLSANKKYKSEIANLEKKKDKLEKKLSGTLESKEDLKKSEKALRDEKEFADLLNDTLREGFLVLDQNLRVKTGNSSFYDLFQVEAGETEGKLLYELGNNQWDIPIFRKLLENILPEKKEVDDYEIEHDFEEIGHRVMILNARQIDHLQLILLVIEDATERKMALQEVKRSRDTLEERVEERTGQLRRLAKRLTESEQNERSRISAILHDDLQQVLYAVLMNMDLLYQKVNSADTELVAGQISEQISEMKSMAKQAIDKTRQLSGDLNPPILQSEDLGEMLSWLVSRFDEMYELKIELKIQARFLISDREVRVMILRILKELLFNIVKHAETDEAVIETKRADDNDGLVICVTDAGKGFDMDEVRDKDSFGLVNVRERLNLYGGNLRIDSARGRGTRMMLIIPSGRHAIVGK
ncbi:MAG: ATP-binding protein [Balneolaceae bacterium]